MTSSCALTIDFFAGDPSILGCVVLFMSIIGPIVSSLGGRESVCTSLLTDGWAIFVGILNASVLSWRVLLALVAGASSCFEGFTGSVVFIVLAATSPAAFLILKEGFVLPLLWASRFMEDGSGDGKCCYQHHPMGRGLFAASLCYLCPGWVILVLLLAGLFVFVFGFPVALGMVAMSGFLIGLALCFFLVKQGLLCGKSRFLQYMGAVMEDSDDGKNAGSTWLLIMFVALIMLGARFAALFCLNMTNRGMDYGAALGTAYSEFFSKFRFEWYAINFTFNFGFLGGHIALGFVLDAYLCFVSPVLKCACMCSGGGDTDSSVNV